MIQLITVYTSHLIYHFITNVSCLHNTWQSDKHLHPVTQLLIHICMATSCHNVNGEVPCQHIKVVSIFKFINRALAKWELLSVCLTTLSHLPRFAWQRNSTKQHTRDRWSWSIKAISIFQSVTPVNIDHCTPFRWYVMAIQSDTESWVREDAF